MTDRRLYPSRPLHGRVAHDIGRKIVAGKIAEGEFLPREAELSRQFAISRQAVREALKVLGAKGLVASRRRAGTCVLPRSAWNLLDPDVIAWHRHETLPPDFLYDLMELRRLIEPAAAEYAATRGDPARIRVLQEALDAMRRNLDDGDAFHVADADFHRALFAASGNALIDRLSTIVGALLSVSFSRQAETDPDLENTVAQHEVLAEAITNGDGEAARRAMEVILEFAMGEIDQVARQVSDPVID